MSSSVDQQVTELAIRVCEGLASPVALKVALLLRYGEWDQLAGCKVDPKHYLDAETFWRDNQAVSLLRKLRELPTSIDRKAVAEESFLACEAQCFRTNQRLNCYSDLGVYADQEEHVSAFIRRARKIVKAILGPRPPDDIEGRFGPGATFGDRGKLTTVPDKMTSSPTLTADAKYFLLCYHGTAWAQAQRAIGREINFVPGNRFTTVPKDCTKDRGIAIEPSINVFYQLGVGRLIRERLRRFGIDLSTGQDIHRRVAREASIRGHLCTLDLSNASDTVSTSLVRALLPGPWFELLDDLRSKKTQFRGRWHVLEKFSSMGNGFTFELETLLFLGLILACDPSQGTDHHGPRQLVAGKTVFVFGDDLIFPSGFSKDVMSVLKFFGMTVNEAKSFVSGPFRESCGGDYFEGVDVRPFFLKQLPNEPQQLISMANGLRASCKGHPDRLARLRRAWFGVLDALPADIRGCRGPSDLGDLVVHDEEIRWQFRQRSNGIRYFRVYRPSSWKRVKWAHFHPEVVLATAVYGIPSGGESRSIGARPPWRDAGVIPRDAVEGFKIGWVPFS